MSGCPNCKETSSECACLRNKCLRCGEPVGNITFTWCDTCWDKDTKNDCDNMHQAHPVHMKEWKKLYNLCVEHFRNQQNSQDDILDLLEQMDNRKLSDCDW